MRIVLASLMLLVAVEAGAQSLAILDATVRPGDFINVLISGAPGNPTDWVALYPVGEPNNHNYVTWKYLNQLQSPPGVGIQAAQVSFVAPYEGVFNVRLFANNTLTNHLATSEDITADDDADPPPTPVFPPTISITGFCLAPGVCYSGVLVRTP